MEFLASLHPVFVHFPIALFLTYVTLESVGIIFKKDYLNKSANIILIVSLLFSLLSVLTGNQAEEVYRQLTTSSESNIKIIEQHSQFATYTLWFITLLFFYRNYLVIKKKFSGKVLYLIILLGIIGSILIITTGLSGGKLVYEYGIGIYIK